MDGARCDDHQWGRLGSLVKAAAARRTLVMPRPVGVAVTEHAKTARGWVALRISHPLHLKIRTHIIGTRAFGVTAPPRLLVFDGVIIIFDV
jgi:hypothetical protein